MHNIYVRTYEHARVQTSLLNRENNQKTVNTTDQMFVKR